jgi:hypothetical protein
MVIFRKKQIIKKPTIHHQKDSYLKENMAFIQ